MFFAIIIGVVIGILITRIRVLHGPAIKTAGMIYTIPSLALFGIMIPIVGIGFAPAVIALTLYSLLVLIRNTAVGIDEVDQPIIEAARGMGMTDWQILWQIEVPLALPSNLCRHTHRHGIDDQLSDPGILLWSEEPGEFNFRGNCCWGNTQRQGSCWSFRR